MPGFSPFRVKVVASLVMRLRSVDAGDTMADGKRFSGPADFKQLLIDHPEQIARCITEKLVTYATGQPVGFEDYQVVDAILEETKASDFGLRSIVHAVIASELFQKK